MFEWSASGRGGVCCLSSIGVARNRRRDGVLVDSRTIFNQPEDIRLSRQPPCFVAPGATVFFASVSVSVAGLAT
jgi:hypothetical protein